MTVELLNIDCMEYMKTQEDNAFDLAIVDPPYGIGDFRRGSSRKKYSKITWNNSIPSEKYFIELERVAVNRIIWGVNYYGKYVKDVGRIVHDKTGGNKIQNPRQMSNCDIASHSFGVNMRIFHYMYNGNVIGGNIDWENVMRWHPCQKPIAVYSWLLKNYAKPGQRILDTHLGSGSSAIAAHYYGCDFVGCEIDKDYFEEMKRRFDEETRQKAMVFD